MSLYRPKMGIGTKTMIAMSVLFWVPMTLLVGLLFYLFNNQFHEHATDEAKTYLEGAQGVYQERLTALDGLLTHLSGMPNVRRAFAEKDSTGLQDELLEVGKLNSHLTVLIAVDENQRVIGRRSGRLGDIANIGAFLSEALLTGHVTSATELVSREFLLRENEELGNLVKEAGAVQFVAAPVKAGDEVVGALVAGILLSGDAWLANTVYKRFGVEMALFAGSPPEASFLQATASVPRSSWAMGQQLPKELKKAINLGRPYYGPLMISGVETMTAFEPIKDSSNRIIGAFGVSSSGGDPGAAVLATIAKGTGITAAVGLVIALVITLFVFRDINRPMRFLVDAMQRFGNGELGINVNLKTGDQFEELGKGFNLMATGIRKREERFKKQNEVAKLFMSTLDLDDLLDKTLKIVVSITDSQMGILYLWEEEGQCFVPHALYGTASKLEPLGDGEGFPGRAAKDRSILVLDTSDEHQAQSIEMGYAQSTPRQVAYIPLVYQERVLGVLVLGSVKKYGEDEVTLFDYLADQISIALDNAMMHKQVQALSITDGLTGLHNRRFLNERLEQEWARCQRHGQPISILLSDIDNFKSVNDNFGHDKGDEVLRDVAKIFKASARKEDLVARYGGEEFVVVLANTSSEDACHLAERICQLARDNYYPWMERAATLSIGVATFPEYQAENSEELIQAADQSMYKAKMSGKDKVMVYSAEQDQVGEG